jgi:hypothetical protein
MATPEVLHSLPIFSRWGGEKSSLFRFFQAVVYLPTAQHWEKSGAASLLSHARWPRPDLLAALLSSWNSHPLPLGSAFLPWPRAPISLLAATAELLCFPVAPSSLSPCRRSFQLSQGGRREAPWSLLVACPAVEFPCARSFSFPARSSTARAAPFPRTRNLLCWPSLVLPARVVSLFFFPSLLAHGECPCSDLCVQPWPRPPLSVTAVFHLVLAPALVMAPCCRVLASCALAPSPTRPPCSDRVLGSSSALSCVGVLYSIFFPSAPWYSLAVARALPCLLVVDAGRCPCRAPCAHSHVPLYVVVGSLLAPRFSPSSLCAPLFMAMVRLWRGDVMCVAAAVLAAGQSAP